MIAAAFAEFLVDRVVTLGIEVTEAQVLEFLGPSAHAQPVGDRGEDIQGLCGDALALFRLERIECAHIVEPVGQLDQDNPDILGHRQQHLAEVLCLRVLA